MLPFIKKKEKVKHWEIEDEIIALTENLKSMNASDEEYEATVKRIRDLSDIRDKQLESRSKRSIDKAAKGEKIANIGKAVGTVGILGFLGYFAMKYDSSDEIMRNKNSEKLVFKFLKL